MKKVMLISMPFGALDRQPIGISLLKSRLGQDGISCKNRHFIFEFADFIGVDDYNWISNDLPYVAFAGDWSFTQALYGYCPGGEADYFSAILKNRWRLTDQDCSRILNIRNYIEPFLAHCLAAENWNEYGLIGFTSTFEQNIASLALARRLKSLVPDIPIVFGGANWEAEMGQELHRQFRFVDFVCSGEADESLNRLAKLVLKEQATSAMLASVPGIVYRDAGHSISTGPSPMVACMDNLPIPNYDDYFEELSQSAVSTTVYPALLLETSRGCWWGAKSHCTFCGLNGGSMSFRSKSADRVLAEIDYLVKRWGIKQFEVVDNILDMSYFNSLLPALAERNEDLSFFYEIKANIRKDQVAMLAKSGVNRIQPGIESLSDNVLQLMRKGTKGLRNIQLLKWCRQYHVSVDWNLLYGFPGETQSDYDQMMKLMPAIRFLDPPGACAPIRLDRFSPYFTEPENFGLVDVKPMAPYRFLYPFDEAEIQNIAYFFEFQYRNSVDPRDYAEQVIEFATYWKEHPDPGKLVYIETTDDRLVIFDSRNNSRETFILEGMDRMAYLFCDTMQTPGKIISHLRGATAKDDITAEQVTGFLESLVANLLMVTDGTYYLSLALQGKKLAPNKLDAVTTLKNNSAREVCQ
jgi:ribosomal peptide maturation radical SAM protein 1